MDNTFKVRGKTILTINPIPNNQCPSISLTKRLTGYVWVCARKKKGENQERERFGLVWESKWKGRKRNSAKQKCRKQYFQQWSCPHSFSINFMHLGLPWHVALIIIINTAEKQNCLGLSSGRELKPEINPAFIPSLSGFAGKWGQVLEISALLELPGKAVAVFLECLEKTVLSKAKPTYSYWLSYIL